MHISAVSRLLVCVMSVTIGACAVSNAKVMNDVLVDTPHGTVFLQNAEDGWFKTAHPFDLSPNVLATVFQGVHVRRSATDPGPGNRVFSDEDSEFLSPLMSAALSKATRRQVVGFRVAHDLEGGLETTSGFLYIQGRLLHLTLTHYRARRYRSVVDVATHRLYPNPTGLDQQQITFTPESVRRSHRHEQPDVTVAPPLASLVLDYEALIEGAPSRAASVRAHPIRQKTTSVFQQLMEPAFPINGASVSRDSRTPSMNTRDTTQQPGLGQDDELNALKKEVRRLHRRLSEFEADTQRTKQPEPSLQH